MMDLFQPRNNSEGHICSTVHGEECCSPCIGDVGNFAMQTSKGDLHLRKPVNERQKSSFRTGSRKRQFKSPREGDNDDDNHETLPMIRRQLYGPGGPYEHKVQVRSSCEGDNDDDNHETLAIIRQQLYGPGGPYGNMRVNPTESESHCSKSLLGNLMKRCWDDHEDEEQTAFSQQPTKKDRLSSSESRLVAMFWHLRIMSNLKPVHGRQKSSFRTGSRKRQFKSPREGDNDDDNHETLAMIRQQLYGPGGPYGNMRVNQTESESHRSNTSLANHERCRDDQEDEEQTTFSQQPTKKARVGSSESKHVAVLRHLRDMSNLKPPDSESHCSKTLLAKHKRCWDDHEDEEQTAFSQQPAKKARIGVLDVKHLALSGGYVDKTNMKSVNRLPKSRCRTGSHKVHFKLPHEGDNDSNKTHIQICPQQYGPVENLIVSQVDPSVLASSSFHQQATTNGNSSLYSLSSGASGSNQVGTSTDESTSGHKSMQTNLRRDTGCNTDSD